MADQSSGSTVCHTSFPELPDTTCGAQALPQTSGQLRFLIGRSLTSMLLDQTSGAINKGLYWAP